MFRMAAERVKARWEEVTADILGSDLGEPQVAREAGRWDAEQWEAWRSAFDEPARAVVPPRVPSHRPPLRFKRSRRPGTVPVRATVCLSPVRSRDRWRGAVNAR
jgi:hypothetical protein